MSPKSLRLAVLSDLHLDRETSPKSWALAKAAFRAAVEHGADHVVVAGDTFDCSTAMEEDRDRLQKFLAKEGLWRRDRLTIVVGNHDVFHTGHRGGRLHVAREAARIAWMDGQEMYEAFCAWAGELVAAADRRDREDLFPLSKELGHCRLTCLDTTESTTAASANASLAKGELPPLATVADRKRHVLAFHNAPIEGRATLLQAMQGEVVGFSRSHLRRLERFADDAGVDAVVCGHIHDNGDDGFRWRLTGGQPVHLMGRTGGVHGTTPTIGLLDIPAKGGLRWSEIEL